MIASFAMAATGAVVSHQNASAQAKQTEAAIKKEESLQQADLMRQRDQQYAASAAEMNEHARTAMKEAALFDVVTGEYGGGTTTDRAATIGRMQNNEQLATMQSNASTAAGENSFRSNSIREMALSRIGSIQRPSNLGTALQIGAAAANSYAGYKTANTPKKKA
jgi:hypothetical protein